MSESKAALYTRAISYSDEFFFSDPDPILDAALRAWRRTGDRSEVLSLLAFLDENHEVADSHLSTHDSIAEAESALPEATLEIVSGLTFVDFGFETFGISVDGSARWYSMEDDDEKWSELFDSPNAEESADDLARLANWCDAKGWPRPTTGSPGQRAAIADRSMDQFWVSIVDEQPDAFAADIVADQLKEAGRNDLLIDLWATLVRPLVYVGPPPGPAKPLDLQTLSYFAEQGIDTSEFSATSLAPDGYESQIPEPWQPDPAPSTPTSRPTPPSNPSSNPPNKGSGKGFFGRLFGK